MEKRIDKYSYTVVKDQSRNIVGVLVRFENEKAVLIPLIDIILLTEKIV